MFSWLVPERQEASLIEVRFFQRVGLEGRVLRAGPRRVGTSSGKALESRRGKFFIYLEPALVWQQET